MIISAKPLRSPNLGPVTMAGGGVSGMHGFGNGRLALQFAINRTVSQTINRAGDQNGARAIDSAIVGAVDGTIDSAATRLLVPALFCQSALEPLADAAITYYDVQADGTVDARQLQSQIESGDFDAVIINHLFGSTPSWRADLYAACRAADTVMIDDMCHCPAGLLATTDAQNHDAQNYDARIFSFRKFLPVPTGGAAQLHPRFGVSAPTGVVAISLAAQAKFAIEKLIFALGQKWLWLLAMRGRSSGAPAGPLVPAMGAPMPAPAVLPDMIARLVDDRSAMAAIRDQRRALFTQLARITPPVNAAMGPDDAPQVFALSDPAGTVRAAMKAAGIACFGWPADELPYAVRQDPTAYPHAVALADSILCLPVHQDLTAAQMTHMITVLSQHCGPEVQP